jgi:hypothetical protein
MTVYKSSSKIADTGVHGINFGSQQIKQIFTAPRTNGITYIPQDIKFEIVDGTTPTLYAGSEVWVPYGRSAPALSIGDSLNGGVITEISWDNSALFYKVRYDTDLTIDITDDPASTEFITCISPSHSYWWFNKNVTYSQDTAPSGFGRYSLWYDTAENIVKITNDSGSTWQNYASLPVGVFTMAGTGATKKLKYVFNGVGYIGTTVFAVPGVKGLMGDGLNEDGSYKSIERTFDRLVMRTMNFNRTAFYGVVLDGEYTIQGDNYIEAEELPAAPNGYVFCYRKSDNTLWWTLNNNTWVQRHGLPIGFWTTSTSGISNFNPAKNFIKVYQYNSYEPQQILVNISGTASTDITFKRGVYYIRAQGAGGGGGNYAYPYGNGNGGGSGAGFEGYIYVSKEFSSSVTTGVGGNSASAGVNTQINGVMLLGAGQAGPTTSGGTVDPSGVPGTITIDSNNLNNLFTIISTTVNQDGNYGSRAIGGNSVLTNSGAGQGGGGAATAPGAGGGGTSSIGGKGGPGGDGECLIQYIGYEPEGGVTKLEYFQTPTLTGSITPVAEGNIVVTSSYNNTSSWNNRCNNSYIMRNTISTTSDSGYWQMNGSNTQWLQIKFPYTLIIKGMTIASRPNDNYTGTVTAYTNADKIVNMGSVTTNAKATNFTLTNIGIGAFVTDTIYLYITDMNEWYGLQNLQIRGYKVLDKSLSLSFSEPDPEPSEVTYYCYDDTGSNYTYLYTTTTNFVVGKPVTFHINKQIKDNVAYTELATSSADFNDTVSVTPTNLGTNSFKYELLMSGYYLTYEFKRTPDYDFTE